MFPIENSLLSTPSRYHAPLNDYALSFSLLGIVEGITEFLPVSSTAHLRIAEALLGIDLADGYWKMFSIVIQLGAILCLPIYFRKRIANFFATFPNGTRGDKTAITHPLALTAHRIRLHRRPVLRAHEGDRQKSRKP